MQSKNAESVMKYQRSKKGLPRRILSNQITNSKRRGHKPPDYSLNELRDWLFKQEKYDRLHERRVESGYSKLLTPSCDRLKDNLPYSLDNMELKTRDENNKKAYKDRISGLLNGGKSYRPVIQKTPEGKIVNEYVSISIAARENNLNQSSITMCCQGSFVGGTYKGYRREYKDLFINQ